MKKKVTRKQHNSRMCLVCGLKNPYGLKTAFYEVDGGELVGLFTPCDHHQSYPGRLHGGITAALLDETIGRAMRSANDEIWGVTVELTVKFRKPIPLDQELRCVGRITNENSRMFEGTGEILLPNGDVAASAVGKYLRLPIEKIGEFDPIAQEWKVVETEKDPKEIEIS